MSSDERHWCEEAIATCKRATDAGVTMLVVRCQDENGEADMAITNATDPAMVKALSGAIPTGESE